MIIFIGKLTDPRRLLERYERLTGECVGEYKKTKEGKPYLQKTGKPLFISVSHSAETMAVAISEKPVGVDVEKFRSVPYQKIADRFFDEASKAEIEKRGEKAFFEIWTAKEARAKLDGVSLVSALTSEGAADNYDVSDAFALAVAGEDKSRYFNFYD